MDLVDNTYYIVALLVGKYWTCLKRKHRLSPLLIIYFLTISEYVSKVLLRFVSPSIVWGKNNNSLYCFENLLLFVISEDVCVECLWLIVSPDLALC